MCVANLIKGPGYEYSYLCPRTRKYGELLLCLQFFPPPKGKIYTVNFTFCISYTSQQIHGILICFSAMYQKGYLLICEKGLAADYYIACPETQHPITWNCMLRLRVHSVSNMEQHTPYYWKKAKTTYTGLHSLMTSHLTCVLLRHPHSFQVT